MVESMRADFLNKHHLKIQEMFEDDVDLVASVAAVHVQRFISLLSDDFVWEEVTRMQSNLEKRLQISLNSLATSLSIFSVINEFDAQVALRGDIYQEILFFLNSFDSE